ncbi:Ig-like domain repeat protein [Methanobrevibacter sp.]|uniref:Ig-like domain repeat protein n=1 Tax=Methanobrevibacter sp. TaxID=66852 RepID=UPI00386BDB57
MRKKYAILLSLLLAALMMGVTFAAEDSDSIMYDNTTGDFMESQIDDINSDFQDEQVLKDADSEIDMQVTEIPQNVSYSKYVSCHVDISNQDAGGTLYVYVDEMPEYSYGYSVSGPVSAMFQSVNYAGDFGTHLLFVKYVDNSGNYADKILNFTFEVSDYDMSLSSSYGDAILGQDYSIGMSLPFDAKGTLIVTHNGIDYVIPPDAYYWRITIPAENLLFGRNEVKLHFIPSDGCRLPEKTVTDSFNAISKIMGLTSSIQVYGEVEDVSLTLPKGALGHLLVRSADNSFNRAVNIANGRAVVSLKDLNCGKYRLEAKYIGYGYEVESVTFDFSVVPKITVPVFAYKGNATFPVEVVMSQTTQGQLYIRNSFNYEQMTYSQARGTMVVNLTTPNWDTRVTVRYTQGDLTYEREYYVGTRASSPEFDMNVTVSDALKGRDLYVDIEIPSGYGTYASEPFDGYFTLYIDGTEAIKSQNPWIFYNTGSLELGTHEWRVEFENDCYYFTQPKSGTFDVGYFSCELAENITSGHNSVVVKLASDATGMLTLLVDGEECDSQIIDDYIMLLKLPDDLAVAKHDVEVRYTGNYPDTSKKGSVNVDYPFEVHLNDFGQGKYVYGEPVKITVNAHKNATGNVMLSIGDMNYTLELINGTAQMTLTDLECGNYMIRAMYEGDSSFPPKNGTYAFSVEGYAILGPQQNYIYYGDMESINLTLPGGEGNLIVRLDDNIYQSVRLQDGKASVLLDGIAPGVHKLNAYYSGGDYTVSPYDRNIFHVDIRVIYPANVNVDEDAWIYLKIPENAQGKVIMNMNGDVREMVHSNGIINETLAFSEFGDYDFTLMYDGADYTINLPDGRIHVKPGNFNCPSTITDKDNAITFNLPADAKGKVSVYAYDDASGQYSSFVLDENISGPEVSVSLADLKSGRYKLKIIYEDEKYGNFSQEGIYLAVSNTPAISVSVSGNDKRATFVFTLPKDASGGLIVNVEGISYYCKINDGIANLIMDNLSSGIHTLLVRYSGCDSYSATTVESNVTVANSIPARIDAGDASVIYSSGNQYSITVYTEGGALAKDVEVIFKVNGKRVATAKTDANGVARYKIVQKPGSYKITAEALGVTVTKKLTVKHILKLKKVKVKRSAKKLVIKATLVKVNGKYLKGKKITLKFKGKKYTAKTNKKGVAKFTIKKKVLKKLKKGKKVTYQATYLKDTVRYTVKVKK